MRYSKSAICFLSAFTVLAIAQLSYCAEVTFLSPEYEQFVTSEDFIVCFSVDTSNGGFRNFRLYFDKEDITSSARSSGGIITFVPAENFTARPDLEGPHIVSVVLYGPYRAIIKQESVRFYITKDANLADSTRNLFRRKADEMQASPSRESVHTGKVYASAGYHEIDGKGDATAEIDASANGYKGNWFYNAYLYLNSNEDSREQTLQRFMISAGYTKNYVLSIGDVWPGYNTFVLRDQRVRGIQASVKSPRRNFGLDFTAGLVNRSVNPSVIDVDSLKKATGDWDSAAYGTFSHNDSMAFYRDGVYKRTMLACRLNFGTGRIFSAGIDFLKARDDTSSITQVNSVDDSGRVFIRGQTPMDNLVVGADAKVNLWDRRISVYTNYAMSILTKNIIGGALTEEQINNLDSNVTLPVSPEDIAGLIIINMSTLPLPVPVDTGELVNTASAKNAMAWDAGVSLNTPVGPVKEMFEFRYFILGPNYTSLCNPNLSKDTRGFSVADEVRMLDGKLTLRGNFKYSVDDLMELKTEAGRLVDFRAFGMVYPDPKYPSATVNFMIIDDLNPSGESALMENRTRVTTAGITLCYTRPIGISSNTCLVSYANTGSSIRFPEISDSIIIDTVSSDSAIDTVSDTIPAKIEMRMNTFTISVNSRFPDRPYEIRTSFAANLSGGEFGVNMVSPSAGLTWHFMRNTMTADADAGYRYVHYSGKEAENELSVKAGFSWEITGHHAVFASAGVKKEIGSRGQEPFARASYEFRF